MGKTRMRRIVSIFIIIVMLINIMPNFGLLRNISYAAEEKKGIILKPGLSDFEIMTDGSKRYVVNIYMKDIESAIGIIDFTYNSDKLVPAKYTETDLTSLGMGVIKQITESTNFSEVAQYFNVIANTYGETSEVIADNSEIYAAFIEENSQPVQAVGEVLICTINFKVVDDSLKFSDIKAEDFVIDTEYSFVNIGGIDEQEGYFHTDGFSEATEPVVTEIKVTKNPKKEYIEGESLDLSSMEVTAIYDNDPTNTKVLTSSEYSTNADALDLTTAGTKTLTITYLGTDMAEGADAPTASVDITVRAKQVTNIEIQGLDSSYKQGTEIDLSKISVIATYENDSTDTRLLDSSEYDLSATGNSIVGEKIKLDNAVDTTITATYKGTDIAEGSDAPTATHTITITEKVLEKIEVTAPTKDVYTVGEKLDLTGMTVKAIYDNGETPTVTDYTTSIANETELTGIGVQTITITYGDKQDTVDVLVFPTKLVGTEGENLSTVVTPEGFEWVNEDTTVLSVGESGYTLKYINTTPEKQKTCNNVKVLGVPTNLTATYGDTLADVKYNNGTLPTGFAWANTAESVGDAGDQTHNITYADYTGLTATVKVAKKALTKDDVIPNTTLPTSKIYDGTEAEKITVTLPNGAGTPTITYYKSNGDEATEVKNVDTYTVKVSVAEGANYTELAEVDLGTYTIGKARLQASDFDISGMPENNTKEYDGQKVTVTATVKTGIIGAGDTIIVKYYKDGVGTTIAPSDYGTYEVKANVNEGDNYWPADRTPGNEEISLGTFTITGTTLKETDITYTEPENLVYDGNKKEATVEIPEKAGDVTIIYEDEKGNQVDPTNAGTYTVKITTTGGDNYDAITEPKEVGTFTITPREVTVTIEDKTSVYGEELKKLTSDVTVGTVVTGDDLGITLSKEEGTDAKEYAITGEATNTNYDVTFVDGTYTITAKEITVTIKNATSEYKQTLVELLCATNDELVGTDSLETIVELSTDATETSNVGEYDITGKTISDNYDVTFENEDGTSDKGTYEITRSTLKLENFDVTGIPENNQKKYDGQPLSINATVKTGIIGAGNTVTVKYYKDGVEATNTIDYGTYTVKININEGANYFAADGTDGKPEIEIGTVTITPKDFDASKIKYTDTAEYDGTVKTDDISITDDTITEKIVKYYQVIDGVKTEVSPKDAGTYTIEADITTQSSGHIGVIPVGTFTITPREITVEIGNAESSYGKEFNEATATITVGELATGDSLDKIIELTKAEGKDVGTYAIIGESISDNYNVTFAKNGTYTIKPMSITVTIGNADSVYGETEATLDNTLITLADGTVLPYEETVSDLGITLTKAEGTNVGTYDITGKSTNENYDITFVDGEYEITRATLVASDFDVNGMPENNTKEYDGNAVTVTATVKSTIIGAGNTVTVKYYKNGVEVANPTEVGTYVVTVNINEGANYFAADGTDGKPEIEIGTFEITKSNEPFILTGITFVDKKVTYNKAEQEITVTGTIPDGIIVTYEGNKGTDVGNYNATATFTIDENSALYEQYGSVKVEGTEGNTLTATLTIEQKDPKDEPEYDDDINNDELNAGYTKPYKTVLSSITLPTGNKGTYTWKNPTDEVGNVGTRTHKVIYTPTDTNYKPVELDVNIEVTPIDPEYNIGELEATYGDTLADVTLPAGFNWNDVETTSVGNAGKRTFKVTFTPADTDNYNILTNIDATINVKKAIPEYTAPIGLEGYEGQPISSIDITAHTGFSWTSEGTIIPLIKDNGEIFNTTVTFTPVDTDNYEVVENIPVEVKVKENEIIALRVTSTKADGSNPEYFEGQSFDRNDIKVEAEWAIGGWQEVTDYDLLDKDENALDRALEQVDTKVIVSYAEKTAEQPITVKEDYVTDITITAPSKLDYNYGDAINLTGATITKVWASGLTHTNDTMPMTKDMLSINEQPTFDFDSMNKVGTHTVVVTVDGKTSKSTFGITVKDEVAGIEIEHPEKLQKDYFYGDSIKVTDKDTGDKLDVLVKYAGETPDERVELTTDMISVENTNVENGKVVTVTYRDNKGKACTDTYTINVKDYIKDIKVTNNKSLYKIGESGALDIEVSGILASNSATTPIVINPGTVDTTSAGSKTITISYTNEKGETLTKDVTVKVIDATEDIFISNLPKQTYNYGEPLNLDNGTITVKTLSNPNGKIIPMTDASIAVTGYNANQLGDQTLTVTYTYTEETETGIETKTWTDSYIVTVTDYETDRIQITPPTKRNYDYGESLDLTGGTVSKVMASGALKDTTDITGEMVSGYNANKVGTQNLTVTYDGKTATFDVTVVDRTLGISMKELPDKIEYTQGEAIDVTGAVLNVTKQSGTKEVEVTKEMISGYDPNKVGTQVITVTYDGKQTEFVINVKEAPKKPTTPSKPINPVNPPKPSTSEVEKYTVTFINYDGEVIKTEEVEAGKSATAPEVEARPGYKFIGWNRNFDTVEEDLMVMAKYESVIRAEVDAPDNMEVEQGQDIDLSEVTLKIFDEDGNEIDKIPVTEDMISGFDSNKIGVQIITVTYVDEDGFEYTATFKVKVVRPTEVLGVKDEVTTEENNLNGIIIPATIGVGAIGLLLLLIGLATRKNVQIYALTEDERKLIGKEKITKHDRRIVLDGYEKKLENANIEIVLNKKITRKLDEEMIDIVFKGKKATYKVKDMYNKEFTIKMKNV